MSATIAELYRQARAHHRAGRVDEAIAAYRAVLRDQPGYGDAWFNLGLLLERRGLLDEAARCFARVSALAPRVAAAHHMLGLVRRRQRRLDEALACLATAQALAPDDPAIRYNAACTLDQAGRPDEARAQFEATLRLEPGHLGAHVTLLGHALAGGDHEAAAAHRQAIELLPPAAFAASEQHRILMTLAYRQLFTPLPAATLSALTARVSDLLDGEVLPVAQPARARDPQRRLKIGYLSPNFSNHPVGHVTRSLFAAHDRQAVEVHVYASANRSLAGGFREAIAAGADRFVELDPHPPAHAAARIAADAIDILVDLDGYMDATSPPILAHRPAPVQAFWLGHAGGLGLSCVDYLIADRVVVPPDEDALYRERVVRLPGCYHATDRHPIAAATPSRTEQGLPEDAIVFCAFNNPEKIDAAILAAWFAILRRVPRGVLWLSPPGKHADHRDRLRGQARLAGIDPARLVFATRVNEKSDHLARHRVADLFLDTITLNAATTALDALWAGLPVLTRSGDRFANRMCSSFLTALDMGDMIAPDLDAYVARAVELADDDAARVALCARLATAREHGELFKVETLARRLEAAYRAMWLDWLAGRAKSSRIGQSGRSSP